MALKERLSLQVSAGYRETPSSGSRNASALFIFMWQLLLDGRSEVQFVYFSAHCKITSPESLEKT